MRILRKIIRFTIKFIFVIVIFVIFLVSLFYINTTIYKFPEPKQFNGNIIHNPYENLPERSFKGNFHAHTIAWKEVTNGHNTEADMFREYTNRGYDIVGISNYHKISTYAKKKTQLYVPVYEHGYNIFKSHYLSIATDKVSFFDYPLFQITSHKQKVIENLKKNNAIVAMAHPKFAGGRTYSDMRHLVHYDFTEVLNHYRISDEYWDQALSAGRLTWVMGNDDTHDLIKEPSFMIWNIIHCRERSADSIMSAMKSGKNYGVHSINGLNDNKLISCEMSDSLTLKVKFDSIVNVIEFVGQNGKIMKRIAQSDSAEYTFSPEDTYIRTVARNTNSTIYLNPLFRYDGKSIPLNANVIPGERTIPTWIFRITAVLFSISLLLLMRKIIRR